MKDVMIQIGSEPGWKTPVLNIVDLKTWEVISVKISKKKMKWLKARGVPMEG